VETPGRESAGLEAQLPTATDEQYEQYRRRQIEWMRQTQMAVVVSEEQGEVEKFRKWELDITPHRRLQRLQRLLQRNPLRTDFQKHYEEIVAEYNREKDRVTIEKTFEAFLQIMG